MKLEHPKNRGWWNVDKLTDVDSLSRFLEQREIRWVVKSPDYPYPASLAAAFQKLEDEGGLRRLFRVGEASMIFKFSDVW